MNNDLILATTMGSFSQLLESISSNSSSHFVTIASDKLVTSSLKVRNPIKFKVLPEDIYFDDIKNESDETITCMAKSLEQTLEITITQLISYDRRFCFGKNVKFTQSYSPYFTYDYSVRYILSISRLIDQCFQKYLPTKCINFGSSNIADILLELYSRHYGVQFRQIKSAKVANYLNCFPSGLNYNFLMHKPFNDFDIETAAKYIKKSSDSKVNYEGSIQLSRPPSPLSILIKAFLKFPRAFVSTLKHQFSGLKDHHFINPILYWYFSCISQPYKWLHAKKNHSFQNLESLNANKNNSYYVLFPLHHEPEVSIQVYGNESLNQIEAIRKLSLSTPHDVLILVKEHPRSIGFRSSSFYSKLEEIPKVLLVDPYVTSTSILSITDMAVVISSSIAIESACKKIPVLHYGDIFIQGISQDMIQRITSIQSIRQAFFHLRYNYKYDHNCLLTCIAKYINGSLPVNLYSSLLSKTGREVYEGDVDQSLHNLQLLIEAP